MKVSCLQENMSKGLGIVGRAVASRSTLPVLSNILLKTDGDRLKLQATNLEIGITCWIGARVERPGAVTVPGRLMGDLVNSFAPERVDLDLDETTQILGLRCGRQESHLKGIQADEFPIVQELPPAGWIELDTEVTRAMINQVAFSAAADESRPVLTGVLVQFDETSLTMAAADGFRMSVRYENSMSGIEPAEAIIPARALVELQRITADVDEPVRVYMSVERKQVMFGAGDDIELVAQTIEGKFPDYSQILPKGYATRCVLETAGFLKAVRLCHLFARDSANIVAIEIKPAADGLGGGLVSLAAKSAELGDSQAELDAAVEGPEDRISINTKYLIDALGIVGAPQVALEMRGPAMPAVLKPVGDDKFIHVIMPMNSGRG